MILEPSEIRPLRTSAGLTQQQLAAKSGVHITVISRLENGCGGNVKTLETLTAFLVGRVPAPGVQQVRG